MTHLDKVYHCPRCDLRFQCHNEMAHHLREDHPSFRQGSYAVAPQAQASARR